MVPEACEAKLLGVNYDAGLTFRGHLECVAKRASQRLGLMKRASRVLDQRGLTAIYKGFVRPVMEYTSICWMSAAPTYLHRLDRLQERAMRTIGPDVFVDGLDHRRRVGAITYLFKLMCAEAPAEVAKLVPARLQLPRRPITRRQVQTCSGHGFLLSNPLPIGAADRIRRAFPFCIINDWNSLPPVLFDGGIKLKAIQRFKEIVHMELRKKIATEAGV